MEGGGRRGGFVGGWGEQVHLHAKFIRGTLNVGANAAMTQKVYSEMHKCQSHKLANRAIPFFLMAKPNLECNF